jgi:hypothetical protein
MVTGDDVRTITAALLRSGLDIGDEFVASIGQRIEAIRSPRH